MTVTLDLPPDMEAEISEEAAEKGQDLSHYLLSIIQGRVTSDKPRVIYSQEQLAKNQAALAVLRQWREEDATDDPEEIARRQAEWEEFKEGMNKAHTSDRVIYP